MVRRPAGNTRPFASAVLHLGLAVVLLSASITGPRAQESLSDHPLDSAARALGVKTPVGKMPDFVEQSRRADTKFMSVGTQHPTRTVKAKKPDEVKSIEAELDAARMRNERIAGHPITPLPGAPGSPAKAPKAAKIKPTATGN